MDAAGIGRIAKGHVVETAPSSRAIFARSHEATEDSILASVLGIAFGEIRFQFPGRFVGR